MIATKRTKYYRLLFGIWCILFLLFALVKWNDPDPELWTSIYAFAAMMSALAFFNNKFYMPLLILGAIAGIIAQL
ncbi:transmembrane 220 family protein [Salegentibacter sp. JZCK2]|uniref:transmembrane 220 family protein n=1 Tax=Salegentibacter tibetensis TaxID=2873600 RepID=UPI001CCAEE9E|nr:transmembrane 220 family protein [Salegentibacter tibetensis]MBZ9731434.1 transmembrane 220 family protein [Salegentibacter tibetensis]